MQLNQTRLVAALTLGVAACAECPGYPAGTVVYPGASGATVLADGDVLAVTYLRASGDSGSLPHRLVLTDDATGSIYYALLTPSGGDNYEADLRAIPNGTYLPNIDVFGGSVASDVDATGACTGANPIEPEVTIVRSNGS